MKKPVQYVISSKFASTYSQLEIMSYVDLAKGIWKILPVDMLVFENSTRGKMRISTGGYHVNTGVYHEYELIEVDSLKIKNFWLKYDEHENSWIGTFMFPEEY